MMARLSAFFGLVAVMLAAIGLHGNCAEQKPVLVSGAASKKANFCQ
jgi:hypothetical protein